MVAVAAISDAVQTLLDGALADAARPLVLHHRIAIPPR